MRRIQAALRVRPGEGPLAGRLLAMMFVALAGAAVGANGVESLFFSLFGPHFLPYLYVVLGVVTFGIMMAMSAAVAGPDPTRRLVAALLVLVGVLLVARATLLLDLQWFYPVLWVVMMIVWTTQVMACWALAGAIHDTRQAKRLFPLYGAGLILGGVAGGLATGPLAGWLRPENLILVWAGGLFVTFLLARSVTAPGGRRLKGTGRRPLRRAGLLREMGEGFRQVRGTPLLRWMSVALVLFALLYFTLALLFAESATERFPRTADLAGFLGLFMGVSNGAALLVSLGVANRLFARFGVPAMVLALAVIYLAGFAALVITSGFATLVAFRFVQMVWVNGVWATGWQALFNVVPSDGRARVRTFMDGGPLQAGIVLSGLLLILAERALGPRELHIAGVVAGILAVWSMWRARSAYSDALVEALRAGNPDVFHADEEPFGGVRRDAQADAALIAGTSESDPVLRRVSVELLPGLDDPEAIEALERALGDPDPEVRAAAAQGLARGMDPSVAPSIVPLLKDRQPAVRRGAVAALLAYSDVPEVGAALSPLLSDPDPEVRAGAAGALLRSSDARARETLLSMAGSPRPDLRGLALVQLAEAGREPERVVAGLSDPDPSVRRVAASVVAGLALDRSLAPLVGALGDPDRGVRDAAARALTRLGPAAAPRLVDALSRADLESGAVLALIGLPAADPAVLRQYALAKVPQVSRYHELWRRLHADADERADLLAHAVRDRAVGHALNALRAVTPLGNQVAMEIAVENLESRDPQQRANAIETVEAVGEPGVVRPLLAVWETSPDRADHWSAIEQLLADDDPWVRACAAFVAGGSSDGRLRPAVADLATADPDTLVREVAGRTLKGGMAVETLATLSLMDRIVALRKVPLFRELSPDDLRHVAETAAEHLYPDGSVLAEQGDPGDAMHVVVTGEVRVLMGEKAGAVEVARRGPGYIVGEMAILSEEPRMASLVASGDVRTLSIDRPRFRRIVQERPDMALAVMRELCSRLREAHSLGTPSTTG